jgi:hypothetical protein
MLEGHFSAFHCGNLREKLKPFTKVGEIKGKCADIVDGFPEEERRWLQRAFTQYEKRCTDENKKVWPPYPWPVKLPVPQPTPKPKPVPTPPKKRRCVPAPVPKPQPAVDWVAVWAAILTACGFVAAHAREIWEAIKELAPGSTEEALQLIEAFL